MFYSQDPTITRATTSEASRNTGTDSPREALGPVASRGRFVRLSVKYVDGFKILPGPPPHPPTKKLSHCNSSSNGKRNTKINDKRLTSNVWFLDSCRQVPFLKPMIVHVSFWHWWFCLCVFWQQRPNSKHTLLTILTGYFSKHFSRG